MKKCVQHSSGLYQHLNDSGALASGDPAAIAAAKRQYWSKVRSKWNKEKRKRSKSYTVLLEGQELRAVQHAAKQQQMSGTCFIKIAALQAAGQETMISKVTLGEVRQLLMNYYSTMEGHVQTENLIESVSHELLRAAHQLQIAVLKVLGKSLDE